MLKHIHILRHLYLQTSLKRSFDSSKFDKCTLLGNKLLQKEAHNSRSLTLYLIALLKTNNYHKAIKVCEITESSHPSIDTKLYKSQALRLIGNQDQALLVWKDSKIEDLPLDFFVEYSICTLNSNKQIHLDITKKYITHNDISPQQLEKILLPLLISKNFQTIVDLHEANKNIISLDNKFILEYVCLSYLKINDGATAYSLLTNNNYAPITNTHLLYLSQIKLRKYKDAVETFSSTSQQSNFVACEDIENHAQNLLAQNSTKDLIQLLEHGIKHNYSSANIYYYLSKAYAHQRDQDDAEYYLNLSFKENFFDSTCRYDIVSTMLSFKETTNIEEIYLPNISKQPENEHLQHELALLYFQTRKLPQSIHHIENAVKLAPYNARIHNSYSIILREAGRFSDSLAAINRADTLLKGKPEQQEITDEKTKKILSKTIDLNRALVKFDKGDTDGLIDILNDSLHHLNQKNTIKWYRAQYYLSKGKYEQGWRDYGCRWEVEGTTSRPYNFQDWDGKKIDNGKLLVFREQGVGDEIMFTSCIADLVKVQPLIILECNPKLSSLFRHSFPSIEIVEDTQDEHAIQKMRDRGITHQLAMGDLPKLFRNSRESFLHKTPYLTPRDKDKWKNVLGSLGEGLKIGISWRGGSARTRSSLRSIDVETLLQYLSPLNPILINLQYGTDQDEIENISRKTGILLHNFQEAIDDYSQTSALVSALDCVVSVQTSIVHLAGAINTPTYCLLPQSAEWRYRMSDQHNMIWYSNVKLFQQVDFDSWDEPLNTLTHTIKQDFKL